MPSLPANSQEFQKAITDIDEASRTAVENARKMPRKRKKHVKKNVINNIHLFAVGTTMILGDMILAVESIGLGATVATTSILVGSGLVGAARFNSEALLRDVIQLAANKKSKKGA